MNPLFKKIRHYYWVSETFVKKNLKFLSVSFIIGFFAIILFINILPFFSSLIFQQREIIGIAGRYTLDSIPDEVAELISNPLISIDTKGEIVPVLANSWEVLNEGKTYRFHLKNDLYWNDRKKFTAKDVNYNFQDVEIRVVDDYTIDFNLKSPLSIFPIYLTKPVIKRPLVGVAPLYSVQSYKTTQNIIESIYLIPNKPGIPLKIYRFYVTEEDLINAYKKGEINYFKTPNRNIADVFTQWKNTTIQREIDYNQILTLFFNTKSGLLSERDVRKGIAYATQQFDQYGVPARGPIPPTSWAYVPEVKEYIYNLETAETSLKKYLTASQSGELKLYTFFDYLSTAEQLKKDYEEIGLKIDLKVTSFIPDDFDMLLTSWSPPRDPDQYFFWHSSQERTNLTKLNNQKIDLLLERGRLMVNINQRKNIYRDFQETMAEEVPAYFIYHPFVYIIRRK